jgi:archaeal type IV pilus assembly protein PilA
MNVFGQKERSWRKARKRAVSPIIATILLVAITVVLAAVLYVLISGLTHGPGSTPIGSAFTAGNPVASQCSAGSTYAANGCLAGNYIYTLTIESSTVSFGSVLFEVKTSSGAVATTGTKAGGFSVMTIGGAVAAQSTAVAAGGGLAMGSTFATYSATGGLCGGSATTFCSTSSSLTNLYTIVIDMGSTTPTTGLGYTFTALGTGSYSGTTSALSLP